MSALLTMLHARGTAAVPGYQPRAIRAFVQLDDRGNLLGFVENADATAKGGLRILAPSVKRTSADVPILFADGADYLFGIPDAASPDSRATRRRDLHLALAERCVAATDNPLARAALAFLISVRDDGNLREHVAKTAAQYPGDLCFRVGDGLVTDEPAVQGFWAQEAGLGADPVAKPPSTRCAMCGLRARIPRTWPVSIKGIPGGQSSGTQLVSMNDEAFESYAQPRATGAMTCGPCGERIANGLNDLLSDARHRLVIGGVAYLAWHAQDQVFDFFAALREPQPELVRRILQSPLTAQSEHLAATGGDLITLAVTANASRVVIRAWDVTPVPDARRRLAEYFRGQSVVGPWGEPATPVRVTALAGATVRSSDEPAPRAVLGLLRGIMTGAPPPPALAAAVIRRVSAGDSPKVTHSQAALLTWFLTRSLKEIAVPHELDASLESPAYHCGRALAEIDAIQRSALGKINATVVDRYFGAASSRPATVLGMLIRNAQDHLTKLRTTREGAAIAHDQRLTEILDALARRPIPATLSLTDQTLFCLGFYHQRAEDRRLSQVYRNRSASSDGNATQGDEA